MRAQRPLALIASTAASLLLSTPVAAAPQTHVVVIDKMTPFTLWKEIIDEHNTALAVLIGFIALGISIIIAAAIH